MNDSRRLFTLTPGGPFDLARQREHFGGWPSAPADPSALVMAFPIEGSDASAAVLLRQNADGGVEGEVHGCPLARVDAARRQALAAISLDIDGAAWPAVGERDPRIGELQVRYAFLRPVLFHSPYEAAAAFIIGHRISIKQTRALRARIAAEVGAAPLVDGHAFAAFPSPQLLLGTPQLPGVTAQKLERLHAVAHAAQDGWLDRERLRAMSPADALARLQTLPGVGPFFAQGILHRGAGTADGLAEDDITRFAVERRYGLAGSPDRDTMVALAEGWRPYRTWANVLLHVWVRTEVGLPPRTYAGRGSRG